MRQYAELFVLLSLFVLVILLTLYTAKYVSGQWKQFKEGGYRFSLGYLMAWILVTGLFTTWSFNFGRAQERVQQTPKGQEIFNENYGWPFKSIDTRKTIGPGYYLHRPEILWGGAIGNMMVHALFALALVHFTKRVVKG